MLAHIENRSSAGVIPIPIEAAGTHQFDLGHLRRAGAGQLIRMLLLKAKLPVWLPWRLRIDKKIHCGGQTRAVTVVGSKPWCCYLKIKPGDNDTAHLCSLLMPDGYRSETVYNALKDAEDAVNLAWRGASAEDTIMFDDDSTTVGSQEKETPPPAAPVASVPLQQPLFAVLPNGADHEETLEEEGPEDAESEGGAAPIMRGWTHDPDKLQRTLAAIDEAYREGKATDIDAFVAILAERLGWQGMRRKQIGGIFTALARRGLINRLFRGSRAIGYTLTAEGEKLRGERKPAEPGASMPVSTSPAPVLSAPTAPPPIAPVPIAPVPIAPVDLTPMYTELGDIAVLYLASAEKLRVNRGERAQFMAEIDRLDAEAAELDRFVNDPETKAAVACLLRCARGAGAVKQGG